MTSVLGDKENEENERRFGLLAELIASGEAVALVGAGSSKRASFDLWPDLVERLVKRAIELGAALPAKPSGDLLARAQEAKVAMGMEAYANEIGRAFSRQALGELLTPFHHDLASLPFRAFVTTNYDTVIEEALAKVYPARVKPHSTPVWNGDMTMVGPAIRGIAVGPPITHVIHLHGVYSIPSSIILCADEYATAYGGERLPLILRSILATRRIVFIGFSLTDLFFVRTHELVSAALWEWDEPVHFCIAAISSDDAEATRARALQWRRELGIEVVYYEVTTGNHDELDALVARLRAEVERLTHPPRNPPGTTAAPAPDWVEQNNARLRARIEDREN